jgi:rhodanese-related sulfurtransferase/ABC-type phosphate/phosphonate transport system substrate-binding protein
MKYAAKSRPAVTGSILPHALMLALPVVAATSAFGQVTVLINPGDHGDQSRVAVYTELRSVVEQALKRERTQLGSLSLSTDATADLAATRSRMHDVMVAPAHVIGSAVRHGYTPVAALEQSVQAVLVAMRDSKIGSLTQAAGARLGLPLQDSIVTYLVRGEVNAANSTVKRHFASVWQTRWQDALLTCLQMRGCDIVAVERAVYQRWVAAGEPVKEVMQSKPVPGIGVAVREGAGVQPDSLRAALSEAAKTTPARKPVALSAAEFDYVSTLGYFTPRSLPGATVVDAAAVQRLMPQAVFVDTRTDTEFKAGHVPGAKLVPYVEKSPKDADYDAKLDAFDLSKLPQDKATPLIFACNGPECWKSYKASRAAIAAGYTKVHWFRGGFPEWRKSGLQVATGQTRADG